MTAFHVTREAFDLMDRYVAIVEYGYRIDTRDHPRNYMLIKGNYARSFPTWLEALRTAEREIDETH